MGPEGCDRCGLGVFCHGTGSGKGVLGLFWKIASLSPECRRTLIVLMPPKAWVHNQCCSVHLSTFPVLNKYQQMQGSTKAKKRSTDSSERFSQCWSHVLWFQYCSSCHQGKAASAAFLFYIPSLLPHNVCYVKSKNRQYPMFTETQHWSSLN